MFNLPKSCLVNIFLPKKNFEEKVTNGKKVFKDISKITLKYKLSPNTINIEKTQNVPEILIFEVLLYEKEIPKNAIKNIDELIVFPKLFVFKYKDDFCYGIFYENLIKIFFKSDAKNIQNDFKKSFEIENKIEILKKEIEILENKIKKEKQFKYQLELSRKITPLKTQLQTILKELNE